MPVCRDVCKPCFRSFRGRIGSALVRDADERRRRTRRRAHNLGGELGPDPRRRVRVREENRAERDGVAPGRISSSASRPVATPPMPTIGSSTRAAGIDGGECDRLQRRAGEPAGAALETRPERPLVEREAADRVHEREAVGARGLGRAGDARRCPGRRARASRRAVARSPRGRRRRSRRRVSGASSTFGQERLSSIAATSSRRRAAAQTSRVVGGREAADRDPERHAELAQPRQVLGEEARRCPGSRGRSS